MTIQNGYGTLRRVYVRPPDPLSWPAWRAYGWHEEPDASAAEREHDDFRRILTDAGAEVVAGAAPIPGDPDAIYAYDPTLPTDRGLILLRPGKEGRRSEPDTVAGELAAAGIPHLGRIEAPGIVEGGDLCFLDERTLLAGIGYRTNEEGLRQIRSLLEPSGVEVITFDLPHRRGPRECLHLLSFLSPLDADLVVGYLPLMPVRVVQLLAARGIGVVEVPDEELDSMGPNVLALGPRRALALDGNPETRRRMEAAGVQVHTYAGAHISRNGDGGPTCLTRPLDRA